MQTCLSCLTRSDFQHKDSTETAIAIGESTMEIPKRLWIGMIILGGCARLIPHPWNFTPMMAIGLFAGSQARRASTAVLVTMFALVLSDAVAYGIPSNPVGFQAVAGAQ
jgi:hypothetical protein